MAKENLTKSWEIKRVPQHYIRMLMTDPGTSFTLLQYGPYIVMNNIKTFNNQGFRPYDSKNAIFRLMIEVGIVIKLCDEKNKYSFVKDNILQIICNADKFKYEYSDVIIRICRDLIRDIRTNQRERKAIESAMLNYSPIVNYMGTLVKPEMENHYNNFFTKNNIDYDKLDELIKDYIKNHILSIMVNYDKFMNIDKVQEILEEYNEKIIPTDLLNSQISEGKSAMIYFTLVYIRYVVDDGDYGIIVNNIIKLNSTYNKIIKGDKIDISEAMEEFGLLMLPKCQV